MSRKWARCLGVVAMGVAGLASYRLTWTIGNPDPVVNERKREVPLSKTHYVEAEGAAKRLVDNTLARRSAMEWVIPHNLFLLKRDQTDAVVETAPGPRDFGGVFFGAQQEQRPSLREYSPRLYLLSVINARGIGNAPINVVQPLTYDSSTGKLGQPTWPPPIKQSIVIVDEQEQTPSDQNAVEATIEAVYKSKFPHTQWDINAFATEKPNIFLVISSWKEPVNGNIRRAAEIYQVTFGPEVRIDELDFSSIAAVRRSK